MQFCGDNIDPSKVAIFDSSSNETQFKFHVGLIVTDITLTTSFYKRLFGVELIKEQKGYAKFELDNSGLVNS